MRRFNFGKRTNDDQAKGLVPFEDSHFLSDIFDNFFRQPLAFGFGLLDAARKPAIDIYEKGDKLLVEADLPGVDKKDIDIRLEDNILTIAAEKKAEREVKKDNYYQLERSYGSIRRSIRVPEGVKEDQIKASYRDGVLKIEFPKPNEKPSKGRRIELE